MFFSSEQSDGGVLKILIIRDLRCSRYHQIPQDTQDYDTQDSRGIQPSIAEDVQLQPSWRIRPERMSSYEKNIFHSDQD